MPTNVNWEGSYYYAGQMTAFQNIALTEGPGSLIRQDLQKAGFSRKYQVILDMAGGKGSKFKGDLMERLEMLLEVVLADIDQGIMKKMSELQKKAQEMKKITEKQAEKNPGLTGGVNTEASVLQVQLTMLVNRRQQFVEAVTNSMKSIFDANMNAVRRMV